MSIDVAIVGGGPAGLTAAADLAARGLKVVVLERESAAGGIPRHSDHLGYGIRDLRRFITGPAYARRLVQRATAAGAQIRTDTMVTGWAAERTLETTSPQRPGVHRGGCGHPGHRCAGTAPIGPADPR